MVSRITDDGGKFIQHEDGRIVEYFVYGSSNVDARVMLQINGSMGTGYYPALMPLVNEKMKELNIKGISITIPFYGYTSAPTSPSTYKLGDWPLLDVLPVLKAEGIDPTATPIMVEGSSYGAGLALAVAASIPVSHLHLHVPYIPSEMRADLGFPEKIGDDSCFDKTSAWVNSCACDALCAHCCCQCFVGFCFQYISDGLFDDEETKKTEVAAPGSTSVQHKDMKRASRNGKNTWGWLQNMVGSLISKNWGFDVRDIAASEMKVMVSYNLNDQQVGSKDPDKKWKNYGGEWLAEHFTKNARVCKVNIGGSEDAKKNMHGAQQHKILNGEFLAQLVSL